MQRFVSVLVVALVGAALSGRAALAETAEDCARLATTVELDQCYSRIYQQADAALNAVYNQLMAKLSAAGDKALLKAAEAAWISYRDKQCAFDTAGTQNGTIHPIEVSICLTAKTTAQTAELQHQLNCPEGDPTCMH